MVLGNAVSVQIAKSVFLLPDFAIRLLDSVGKEQVLILKKLSIYILAIFLVITSGSACTRGPIARIQTAGWYHSYGIESENQLTHPSSVPKLIKALDDSNDRVRIIAVRSLGEIGDSAKEACPALIKLLLNDSNDSVRLYVTTTLVKIGAEADEVESALLSALSNDKNQRVRMYSAEAIDSIGIDPKKCVDKLSETLFASITDNDCICATVCLGNFGAKAKAGIPALIKTSSTNTNYNVQRYIAQALEKIVSDVDFSQNGLDISIKPLFRMDIGNRNKHYIPLNYGVIPIKINIVNKSGKTIYFNAEEIHLISPFNKNSSFESVQKVIHQSKYNYNKTIIAGAIGGIFGATPSLINTIKANKKIKAYIQEVAIKNEVIDDGTEVSGVVFFKRPNDINFIDTWVLELTFKDVENNKLFYIQSNLNDSTNSIVSDKKFATLNGLDEKQNANTSTNNDLVWDMVAKKIERLGELLQKGLITQEEYNIKKKELLKEF